MKKCSKCESYKELDFFTKNSKSKDGLNNLCRDCTRLASLEYYENHKESIIDKKKKYFVNNSVKISEYQINYRKENSDYFKNYRLNNSDYFKNWWIKNKDKVKIYDKNYRKKYPHVVACRNSLRSCLDRIGSSKTDSMLNILGYSVVEFKSHIESLFSIGMSWDNYGKWHIDHKIPVSKFDKITPINIINSLDNLQPLWANENLSKSNKI